MSFSGQLDLEAMHAGGEAWAGLVKQRSNTEVPPTNWTQCSFCHQGLAYNGRAGNVMAHRLRLFTDIFLGDHLYSLVEVRSDRGSAPANKAFEVRVEQAYLRLATTAGDLGVQLGRFASPFGSYPLRHLTVVDPFMRPPLPYEYRTVLSRRTVPRNEADLLSWQDWEVLFRSPGAPPVWDVPYQAGGMVFGTLGPLDLRLAAMGSSPSSDPIDWGFDLDRLTHPSWVLGVRSRPTSSMELGASYSKGPWMQEIFGGTIPSNGSFRDYDQEIVSADVAYERGPVTLRAEAMLDFWEVPAIEDRLRDLSYTAEVQWDVWTGVSVASRFGLIDFGPLDAGDGTGSRDWDRDVYRLEGSLGYRLVRNAGVMVSGYRQNVRGAEGTTFFGVRLWYAF